MKVIVDTSNLFSALLSPAGYCGRIYAAWLDEDFDLVTCEQQIVELRNASRAPKFRDVLKAHRVGLTINHMRKSTVILDVPRRYEAIDPTDSFLLDLAAASAAHYLITGDKRSGLLQQAKIGPTRIITAAAFCKTVLK